MTEWGIFKPVWRKSSHSSGTDGACVEIAATWRKSSHSSGGTAEGCVEFSGSGRRVLVRDSKDPGGAVLSFGLSAWADLARAIKGGRLNRSA